MTCKKGTRVILALTMALSVAACANKETETQKPMPDSQPASTPIPMPDRPSELSQKAGTEPMEDWEKAYLEYLESLDGRDTCTYCFLYVEAPCFCHSMKGYWMRWTFTVPDCIILKKEI